MFATTYNSEIRTMCSIQAAMVFRFSSDCGEHWCIGFNMGEIESKRDILQNKGAQLEL
jgi:hypothetical protein